MSVNIDKQKAEDVAGVLAGKVLCKCCDGTGKAIYKRGWGYRSLGTCAFCKGKRWLRPYKEYER